MTNNSNLDIVVIISEGLTGKIFLSSFLQSQLNFNRHNPRSRILLTHSERDTIWFFPHPRSGPSHQGGEDLLQETRVYYESDLIVSNHKHLYDEYPAIHYFILTDVDNRTEEEQEEKEEKILETFEITEPSYKNCNVIFMDTQAEIWLMAGMNDDFPLYAPDGRNYLSNQMPYLENITNPKSFLNDILHQSIAGSSRNTADRIGRHFDIDKAAQTSLSFRNFYDILSERNLI